MLNYVRKNPKSATPTKALSEELAGKSENAIVRPTASTESLLKPRTPDLEAIRLIRIAREQREQAEKKESAQKAMGAYEQAVSPGLTSRDIARAIERNAANTAEQSAARELDSYRKSGRQEYDWNQIMGDTLRRISIGNGSLDLQLQEAPGKMVNQTGAELAAKADRAKLNREALEDRYLLEDDVAQIQRMNQEDRELLSRYVRSRTDWANPQNVMDSIGLRADLNAKYGKERVAQLAESWERYQNAMNAERTRQEAAGAAESGFLGKAAQSAATVAANTLGALSAPLGYLKEATTRTGRYTTLDPNNAGTMPGQWAGGVREAVSRDMGTVGKTLYQGTMGTLDNLARIAAAGGSQFGSLGLAALGSFGSTVSEASAKGATPEQAVGLGVASAGIEAATEYIPLDNLFKAGKNGWQGAAKAVKNALKQAGVEATEEEISFLGNLLADAAILREKSDYSRQIGDLVASGMSYAQAREQADRKLWDEVVNTAVTSFVSGWLMSGAQSGGLYLTQQMATESKPEATESKPEANASTETAGETPEQERERLDRNLREAMAELYPREQTDEERLDQLEEQMEQLVSSGQTDTEQGQQAYMALAQEYQEIYQRTEAAQGERAESLTDRDAPPETQKQAPYTERTSEPENPMANRDERDIGNRSVAAYQFENPEIREYYQDAARGLLADIDSTTPGERTYNDRVYYESGGEKGWGGTRRNTTQDLARFKDQWGYSWEKIRQSAEDMAEGREGANRAIAKRLELLLHDRLANGYDTVYGEPIPANEGYVEYLRDREFAQDRAESFDALMAEGDENAPQRETGSFEAMGAASRGFSPYTQMQLDYGNIPEGENAVRPDDAPISTDGTDRVSHTARTAIGAQVTPDEFVPLIENEVVRGGFSFIPISNDQTVQNAVQSIQAEGWQTSWATWKAKVRQGSTGADITATGALLYNHAVNSGNYREAMDILMDYQQAVRNSARGLQAARILKRLTPENRLHMIRRSIQRMVEDMHLDRKITIDENLARRYQETRDDAEADRILDEIARDVARQIPPTLGERITALRYLNMLGNFRTQVRNLAGNLGAKFTYLAKDELAATIEGIASGLSGGRIQRTKVNWVDRETRNAARADYENVADWISSGGRANDRRTESDDFARRVQENRRILPAGLEQYRRATNWAMNNEHFGDAAFGREAYARALAGYLNARGIRTDNLEAVDRNTLNQAREYAVRQAQEATFRDNNQISAFVSQALRRRDTPTWARVIGEAIMPFRKTPANVLVRAEEFSPLGLINSAVNTVRAARGDISGAELVDSWAKSITGTGLFAIGWALANMGYLRGGPDEDEEKAEFDQLNGYQDYALVLPDGTNLTIDSLSPAAMPMLLGAQLDKVLGGSDLTFADLEGMLATLTNPMIEMSMLSGLNDTIDAIRYADNSLGQFLVNAGFNYLTQALGNTLLGQMERSIEGSRMTTYIDKDSNIPVWLQRNLGKLSQKIPGIDFQQTPYIDQWGEEQKNPEGIKNWLYQLLSPSYIDKGNVDEVAQELYRLNEVQTGTNVFPQSPETQISYTDSDGNRHEKYNLSMEELDRLKRTEGQTQARLVAELIGGQDYNALTDAQKAEAVSLCYDYARELARGEVLPGYDGMSSWMQGISGNEVNTIIGKVAGSDLGDSLTALTTAWREGYESDAGPLEELEQAVQVYDTLSADMQKTVLEGLSGRAAAYVKAHKAGMDTQTFAAMYRKYWDIDQREGMTATRRANAWAAELQFAKEEHRITRKQYDVLRDSLTYSSSSQAEATRFDNFLEAGVSSDDAAKLAELLYTNVKGTGSYDPETKTKNVRDVDRMDAVADANWMTSAERFEALRALMEGPQIEKMETIRAEFGVNAAQYVDIYRANLDGSTKAEDIENYMRLGYTRAEAERLYRIYHPTK